MEYISLKRGMTQTNAYSSKEDKRVVAEQKIRAERREEKKREVSPNGRIGPRRFALESESRKELPPRNFKKVKNENRM